MTKRKRQRLLMICIGVMCVGAAVAIILTSFNDNIVFFFSPTDLQEKQIKDGRFIRIGGLVKNDSLQEIVDINDKINLSYKFIITDMANDVTVEYKGILPSLFRGGQGLVAEGEMNNGSFIAKRLLAKHDENYMPPEVADALKKSGHWQEETE